MAFQAGGIVEEKKGFQMGGEVDVAVAPIQPTGTTRDAFQKAGEVWDMSVDQQVPLDGAKQQFADVKEVGEKYKTTQPWRGTFVGGQFIPLPGVDRIPGVPIPSVRTLAEVPKGVVRSLERDFAGGAGTMFDWFGHLIQEGGAALQRWTELGSKNKGQIYNPVAESIIAVGEGVSNIGRESREAWAVSASTGWEAFDANLKETDPISYGAGRISEGLASSALSVTAAYLSGGATAPSVAIDAGIQLNRGLVALSMFSAAGSFEHAQNTGENFFWSTAHGMADGMVEYGMETSFLKNVNAGSRAGVGAKEATEELFTGMIQNTRAGILENTNNGMSAYEAAKKAAFDALKQSPWEMAAGFIGGYGIAGGADLVNLVTKGNAVPLEAVEG
ncbi:MAG: hypothetical protein KAS32_29040, partial [Candidatus Peribacteraceae bacterium]|nr:hypothetical protein [Candidatus Peribacteraceae bacterium]